MSRLAPAATAADLPLDGTNLTQVFAVLAIAIIALVMGVFFRQQVLAADPGTEKMQEIGAAVEEGAQAYLARHVDDRHGALFAAGDRQVHAHPFCCHRWCHHW